MVDRKHTPLRGNDRIVATLELPMSIEEFCRLADDYTERFPDARVGNDAEGRTIIISALPETPRD